MESRTVHLSIKSHPENLKYIRNTINRLLSKSNVSKKTLAGIVLAVDEACSNIIRHSYKNNYTRKIKLTLKLKPDLFTITIIDDGTRFDSRTIEPRNTDDIRPGGLGLYIMEQVMDIVEFSRTSQESNKIRMVKTLIS